jgi:hypothetical protein
MASAPYCDMKFVAVRFSIPEVGGHQIRGHANASH